MKFILTQIIIFISIVSFSQNNPNACVDSMQIWDGYVCSNYYKPVCGCDGVTYRNSDCALHNAGVQFYTESICEDIGIDFYPNPIALKSYSNILTFTLIAKYETDITLIIMDLYGKTYYEYIYQKVPVVGEEYEINLQGYRQGLYFIIAISNKYYVTKKLILN